MKITMKKAIIAAIALIAMICPNAVDAQRINLSSSAQGPDERPESIIEKMKRNGIFTTIELAANIGTTGLGLEVASPMTEWAKLRAGFDWMPPFTVPMSFGLDSYVDGKITDKFDMISDMMYNLSGMTIDREIKMDSKPTMTTFKLLVDVYPFKNDRHWHFTAGFFIGGSSMGTSINKMDEMPSLLALNMYNRFYNAFIQVDDFYTYFIDNPIFGDLYLDPEIAMSLAPDLQELQAKVKRVGELGVHVGDHKDGTPYMMKPDKDGTVSAKAKVNRFRPYIGFGYGGAMSADGKWQASFDAGVQFWGGAPKVTTHDGTVLNDLTHLRDKVGTYMGFMKALPVYPTIDFRISYRF